MCFDFVDSFISCKKPIVCCVNGPSFGIAVTTLGLCDHVLCSFGATFKTPFAELGQSPEGCASFTFPLIMGDHVANEVLWEGRSLNSFEALNCGLVHKVYSPERVLWEAQSYCKDLIGTNNLNRRLVSLYADKLREVNENECRVCERMWVSEGEHNLHKILSTLFDHPYFVGLHLDCFLLF